MQTSSPAIPLQLPDDAVPFIAFQRTAALRFPPHARILGRETVFAEIVLQCVRARRSAIRRRAHQGVLRRRDRARVFATIRDYVPARAAAILDIGCGVAGIDVAVARHYAPAMPDIFLLDKSATESSVYYGFESSGAFYNSLEVARTVLVSNGIDAERVHLREATATNAIEIDRPVDLVVSLISWGFHYPVETYLDRVHELLAGDGTLILDVRKGTGGRERLEARFPRIEIIVDEPKFERIAASKSAAYGEPASIAACSPVRCHSKRRNGVACAVSLRPARIATHSAASANACRLRFPRIPRMRFTR